MPTLEDMLFFVSMLLLVEPGKARFWTIQIVTGIVCAMQDARRSDLGEQGQQAVIGVWRQGRWRGSVLSSVGRSTIIKGLRDE
jgi:hypothetical protein